MAKEKPEDQDQDEEELTAEERAALAMEELIEEAKAEGKDTGKPPEWYRKVYNNL